MNENSNHDRYLNQDTLRNAKDIFNAIYGEAVMPTKEEQLDRTQAFMGLLTLLGLYVEFGAGSDEWTYVLAGLTGAKVSD